LAVEASSVPQLRSQVAKQEDWIDHHRGENEGLRTKHKDADT